MTVIDAARKYRAALVKQDEDVIKRLLETYQGIYARITPRIELFIAKLELLIANGEEVSKYQVVRMQAYRQLLAEIEVEMGRYSTAVGYETNLLVSDAVQRGLLDSRNLVRLSTDSGIVRGSFRTLNPKVIETLTGYLDETGPLFKKMAYYGTDTAIKMSEHILDGVALGQNPRTIAASLIKDLSVPLTDSMRTARTVQIYAYRDAARANYIANSDVVKGWIWLSARDDTTCMGCLSEDNGEIRSNDEILDDHYNGRCTPLPVVYDASLPVEGSGKDWFESQPEAKQRAMMGSEKYEAWKEGKFEFQDLSTTHTDEVYGNMKTETPLKDLIGVKND
jgi:hypothetical protein